MKKYIFVLLFCVLAAGCETVPTQKSLTTDPGVFSRRFISLSQLRSGLTRTEVSSLLGKEVVTGYELADESIGRYTPITVANPYRSETIIMNSRNYVVDYYLVGIKAADDKISDNELMPLIFADDRLIGSGWEYLNQYIKRSLQ